MKKLVTLILLLITTTAFAFTPPKIVNVIIGYPPGGSGNEVSFRAAMAIVQKNNPNVNFVVTNKPGADEVIAFNDFIKTPPDGSTLFVPSFALYTISEIYYPNQIQGAPMDLELVTTIAKSPLCVVANINSPTNTPKELLDRLKNTKTPVNIGLGSTSHKLVYEYLMAKSNGNRNQVQSILFKSPIEAATDVAGNHIEFAIMPSVMAYPLVKAGKIKYIALTGEHKLAAIPEVPLWKDNGIPNLNLYGYWMLTLPPGTPKEIVKYYQDLFVPALESKEIQEVYERNLMITLPSEHSPEGARKSIEHIRETWMPVARKIHAKE